MLKGVKGLTLDDEPDARHLVQSVLAGCFAKSEERRQAMRAGLQAHVVKPITPSELVGRTKVSWGAMVGMTPNRGHADRLQATQESHRS